MATGPSAKPRDDTALHLSVRLNQGRGFAVLLTLISIFLLSLPGYIARNIYKGGTWGDEQGSGKLPIGQAQSFEIIILVDPQHYKVSK